MGVPSARRWIDWLSVELGRIRVRLLIVNVVVVAVPVAGLEFARLYERQLLQALQRDMSHQAVLVSGLVQSDLDLGQPVGSPRQVELLTDAARKTRTRIRLLTLAGGVVADSHAHGPPEGREPPPPALVRVGDTASSRYGELDPGEPPEPLHRPEVRDALAGHPSAHTRIARRPPAVYLFVTEPIRHQGRIAGVVYAVRSTAPVLAELHRIRAGLIGVLIVALSVTALLTLGLAWTISRPLARLARAAKRIAAGERNVVIPSGGGGEISELGEAFATMTRELDARLRYISDFAADVAHEFKSPLTSIRGAAELLAEGAADDPAARGRFLRNIELDASRLDRLVSRLLELSRIEASSAEPLVVDLRALIARAIERCQTPDGTIVLRWETDHAAVLGRASDLETALLNLLDNALRFSPPAGNVTVYVTGARGQGQVAIAVKDQGPGIDPANLPKVFDRFFTTDRDGKGTGLGLAIVRSVARAHGGSVSVASELGRGTTFEVRLPVGLQL